MKFGLGAFLVPAPAVNSWILIALARAAAALADSASRCRRCYHVFCALCTPAFEPVLVLYFLAFATAFRSWPQPKWALLLYAAYTAFGPT